MDSPTTAPRRALAGVLALLVTMGAWGLVVPVTARADSAPLDPANPATPTTVSADALPTVQIDGVVWSQVVVGNTVYAAGRFTSARPAGAAPGTQETVRENLLAYDIRTGELVTSFAPSLNAQALVVTASPDGSRIYVGGDFTRADGQVRNRIAAYSTATGQLVPSFRPSATSQVRAIAATNDTVYFGGAFTSVGSIARHRLAAASATDGTLLPWAPVPGPGPIMNRDGKTATSDVVMALLVTGGGSQVVAAGRFDTLNGTKATGVGALDATTGEARPFAVNQLLTNQGVNSAVYSLSTDGVNVYGTAYDYYGPGNLEGSFSAAADGGTVNWINDCHGDSYSSFPMGGALYMSGHPHVCSNVGGYPEQNPRTHRYATALSLAATGTVGTGTLNNSRLPDGRSSGTLLQGKPAPSLLPWFPAMAAGSYTGQDQAGWSVAAAGNYVVYGGEFPQVNGTRQQGLVRYALPSIAPNRVGPAAANLTPTVTSPVGGMARVSWRATSDQDNQNLTYRVYRDGDTTTPVYEVTRASAWWNTPLMAFTDIGVTEGTHTYRVSVVDPSGNRANSPWATVEVAAGSVAQRPYADAVRADGASSYWPLGESSGTTAVDYAGPADLAVNSGITLGAQGAISGDSDTAYQFSGTNSGLAATQEAVAGPNVFSIEAWFRTTSSAGGKIVGFGNSRTTTNSTSHDRSIYLDAAGRVQFGVYPGTRRIVGSSDAYNDGQWHHVVASLSPAGMALFVDGEQVGSRTDTTSGQAYNGYWRVGGDTSWSGAQYFAGTIDDVAIYPLALSGDRIASHYSLGATGEPTNLAPEARFTAAVTGAEAAFDARSSTDPDGTVASYAWNFGDGTTGSGATASHAYATGGAYAVTLTVTDDDGATHAATQQVTVSDPVPNRAPTASVTATVAGLTVSVDGSGSTDPDGTVASYAWNWGDGSSVASGASADHSYAAAGTYVVTLTVTDDEGAVDSATEQVTLTAPPTGVIAADGFDRTVSGGLGSADVGGPWTVAAGASRQSVTPGVAELALPGAGNNTGSYLGGVSQSSADVRTSFRLSSMPTGAAGTYVYVSGRRVGTGQEYRVRVRIAADGSVWLALSRLSGGSEAWPGGELVVPGLTYAPGSTLNARVQVSGTGTTEIRGTVWAAGTPEPTPQLTRTDITAGLQAAGSVGLAAYRPSSATAATAVRFTGFTVRTVGGGAPEPPANAAPAASFTATATGLQLAVDGSGSTDADGRILGYSWQWGDTTPATAGASATASHTYATTGTYSVILTVTDDDGATATTVRTVTVVAPDVEEPPAGNVLAADAFERTVTGGLGTADVGGAWTVSAGATRQSVSAGTATLNVGPGNNTGSHLGGVSATGVDLRATFSMSQVPTAGSGAYLYLVGRRVGANQEYAARVRVLPGGSVGVGVVRTAGAGTESILGSVVTLPGFTYTADTPMEVRFQVSGTGTTTMAVTVWPAGTAEPSTPTLTRTDDTAGLQAPGGLGVLAYLSGSATGPVAVRLTQLSATTG